MSVQVHRYGTGPCAVVAFHGWSGDHRTFAPLASTLPKDTSIYAFDHPGFGRSTAPARWSFDALSSTLQETIDRLGLDRMTLIGNCSGAFTALHLALRMDPSRIERMVLIDPFAYVPWYFRLLTAGRMGRFFYSVTFANPIGRFVTNVALASKRSASTDLTQSFGQIDHRSAFEYLRLLCSQQDIEPFAPISTQVDILHGERTFAAVRRSIPMWTQLWPWARVHPVRGAGHLPIEEAPTEVGSLIFPSDRSATAPSEATRNRTGSERSIEAGALGAPAAAGQR